MLYSDKNAKVLKELPRIDNVISMYVVGPNKYYSATYRDSKEF